VARMRLWHLQTTRGLGGAQGRARSCAQLPATKSLFLGNQEKDFFSQKFCFMGGAKRIGWYHCARTAQKVIYLRTTHRA
jgi:hypothetical protein